MQDSSAEENYFSEEGIEKGTESLLRKLEHAKDPDAYKERFHDRNPSSGALNQTGTAIHADRGKTRRIHPILVTVIAIGIGALAGILLSIYVL